MANITAAEHPKLVLEMTAMERTTPAHYDEWNVRHQQLLDNDKYLNEQFINVFSDSAAAHNSIYRGKNLTNVYTVLSSSFYDTGCDNIQFPLFRLAPNLKVAGLGHNGSRWWYWLSAVVSAAAFADCGVNGVSGFGNAAGDGGVRPYFCIG